GRHTSVPRDWSSDVCSSDLLADFYADLRRYAFRSQVFFLAARLRQHLREVNPGRRVIQDRTVYEDANVFARLLAEDGLLDPRDHGSYTLLYDAVASALRPDRKSTRLNSSHGKI